MELTGNFTTALALSDLKNLQLPPWEFGDSSRQRALPFKASAL